MKYYTNKNIKKKNAHYNVIFGERSNGKTYSILLDALVHTVESDYTKILALFRRMEADFVGEQSARTIYNSLMCDGKGENQIKIVTNNKFDGVEYYGGKYYLTIFDVDKQEMRRTKVVICIAFALTRWEHYKGGSYPNVTMVLFDEFITRDRYLRDEFVIFQNMLSTIIRKRNDVVIYMTGNTINKYGCPYFDEMGLYKVKNMKQGEIDVYTYGETELKVAVEFSDSPSKNSPSDVYFAFNNPKLSMITGKGSIWEMDIYPHCPMEYTSKNILFTYFIIYNDIILQCEIIKKDKHIFTYIHKKTTPLKHPEKDLIYQCEYSTLPNVKRKITNALDDIDKKISWFYKNEKVFYQSNDIGELVRAYLMWCKQN